MILIYHLNYWNYMKSEHEGIKISLGCGYKYDGSPQNYENDYQCWKITGEGFIGIDKGDYGQHIKRDLRRGLPFCDNSVDEIVADNSLEHIPTLEHFGEDDFAFIMNECNRVLKIGGKLKIIVPYWADKSAVKDPTHRRQFSEETFTYFIKENAWDYGFVKNWKLIRNERPENRNGILIVEMEKIDE